MGMEPPYNTELQFDVPQGDQGDPDESNITETMKQDIKEAVGAEDKKE